MFRYSHQDIMIHEIVTRSDLAREITAKVQGAPHSVVRILGYFLFEVACSILFNYLNRIFSIVIYCAWFLLYCYSQAERFGWVAFGSKGRRTP